MEAGSGKPTAAEGRSPEQIQAEIEETREQVGETVAEIADKADVKKQARRKVSQAKARAAAKKDEAKARAAARKEAVTGKVKETTPGSVQDGSQQAAHAAQQAAGQAAHTVRENPMAAAVIGAFAGGLLIGWMVGRR